jgi:hypothetical protein
VWVSPAANVKAVCKDLAAAAATAGRAFFFFFLLKNNFI